ncbi:hypothetical protein BKP37_09175 [Anaerobacillus alkalilacustris]|uniref:Uncharacterized protein n=1 Tax=Anaerobacillus alkalilacustris TaxID=393763 RepID=A0A1S2LN66_9BACI|nr:hypothetical protein [Anaerobacillus alkalilacustris]OIJ13979.1 hypothetical protein BKP37_09175 [Anaerobacillus alkalilacustris]
MKLKTKFTLFTLFLMLNIASITITDNASSFIGIESLMTTYNEERGRVAISLLTLNLGLASIIMVNLITKITNLFVYAEYIITRASKFIFLKQLTIEIIKTVSLIALIKVVTDVVLYTLSDYYTYSIEIVFISFSYLTTFILWAGILVLLIMFRVKRSTSFFITICSYMLFQIFSHNSVLLSIFVIASSQYKEHICLLSVGKIVIISFIFLITYNKIKKYDLIA